MPRLNARSDARDGGAPTSDIRTRRPALEPRVSASACTDIRGNAIRLGSAIRNWRNFLVRRINSFTRAPCHSAVVLDCGYSRLSVRELCTHVQFGKARSSSS